VLLTPDARLIHAIYQGGIKAYYAARSEGIRAEFLFDEARPIWLLMETMSAKGRLPSPPEIHTVTGHQIGTITTDPLDVSICAKSIVKRGLSGQLNDKLDKVIGNDAINVDPFKVRDGLLDVVSSTAWSYGEPYTINSRASMDELIEAYEKAAARGSSLLGLSSPWPTVDSASLGLQDGELTVVFAKRKIGKSNHGNTLCHDPLTGRERTIKELFDQATGDVLSWEKNAPIHTKTPTDFIDCGMKECLKISWKSGRSIIAAKTHPFLTPKGWVEASKLQIEHHNASAASIPEPLRPVAMSESEIKALAYLIADGGYTSGSTLTWSKQDPILVEDFGSALATLDCRLKPRESGVYTVVTTGSKHRNPVVDLLKHHQLDGKKSVEKEIPQAIFSLPNEQLALFIGCLWSGDGGVHQGSKVRYYSGSRRLVEQLQHLLLRFGVVSFFRVAREWTDKSGETTPHFALTIAKRSIEAFKQHIQLFGEKQGLLEAVTYGGGSGEAFLHVEEIKDELFAEIDTRPELLEEVKVRAGYKHSFGKSSFINYSTGRLKRNLFEIFCEVYDSPLRWVLDENIHWDPIVSIEDAGKHHCYDLTVPGTSCYVANDFIVHNSWCVIVWGVHIWKTDLGPGEKILFVTMEMTPLQVLRRMACVDLHFSWNDFRGGRLTTAERKMLDDWVDQRVNAHENDANIIIVGSNQVRTIKDLDAIVGEYKPKGVIVDSFYILGRASGSSLHERVLANVQGLILAESKDAPTNHLLSRTDSLRKVARGRIHEERAPATTQSRN